MISDINITGSIYRAITSIMTDSQIWTIPFTVYSAKDLVEMEQAPAWPYVFVTPSRLAEDPRFLPIISLEVEIDNDEWELGSTAKFCHTLIDIRAPGRNVAAQLRDILAQELDIIPIYDFGTNPPQELTSSSFVEEWQTTIPYAGPSPILQGKLVSWITLENLLVVL